MSVHVDQARSSSPEPRGSRHIHLWPVDSTLRSIRSDTKVDAAFAGITGATRDDSGGIERIADVMSRLARRNEALEDFAALVAHELKRPLETALLTDEPRHWITLALDLVDSLLQAASESPDGACASVVDCLAEAACPEPIQLTVVAEEGGGFPLPPASLSVILRNLLANAAAAKARRVDVFTGRRCGRWWLVVDDDGVGLAAPDHKYDHGSGIGLELCRRIAERHRGRLELLPRRAGGTRAILTMERAT